MIRHLAHPGPGYWDYRCLVCGEPVQHHPNIIGRLMQLVRDRFGSTTGSDQP